jgi:hypothetical protein
MTSHRRTLFSLCAAAVLAAIAGPARPQPSAGKVTTVQLPRRQIVQSAALADVNGDGKRDLVIATSEHGRSFGKAVRVHLRRDAEVCFGSDADAELALTPDVVAFATGDVEPAPGEEVVLFSARGAFAWRTGAGEDEWPRKLVTADFLWQLPHPRRTFVWKDGVRDVDGDGLPDLFLPEPGGYRVALQRRGEDGASRFETSFAALPSAYVGSTIESRGAARLKARERSRRLEVAITIGATSSDEYDYGVSVADSVPYPVLADWDGDGRLDLVVQRDDELFVWRQRPGGGFDAAPTRRLLFPVEMDRGRRLDLSFSAHLADLNADGRTDCVVVAGDKSSEDPRTQVLVYVQGAGKGRALQTPAAPLFGPKGIPQQLLLIGGFAGSPQLTDVDGDGYPDLVLGRIDVDPVDAIRAASSGKIEADLYVYLNRKGRFSRTPDVTREIEIVLKELKGGAAGLEARFVGDVTGNRAADLLLRDSPDRIRLLGLRRGRSKPEFLPRAIFSTHIPERAHVEVAEGAGGSPPEILVIDNREILHVRFR